MAGTCLPRKLLHHIKYQGDRTTRSPFALMMPESIADKHNEVFNEGQREGNKSGQAHRRYQSPYLLDRQGPGRVGILQQLLAPFEFCQSICSGLDSIRILLG